MVYDGVSVEWMYDYTVPLEFMTFARCMSIMWNL